MVLVIAEVVLCSNKRVVCSVQGVIVKISILYFRVILRKFELNKKCLTI